MRRLLLLPTVALLLLVPFLASADACCMVPLAYPGDVDQSGQDVLIVHDGRHQEMVIRVRPFFREADEAPASLACSRFMSRRPTSAWQSASRSCPVHQDGRQRATPLAVLAAS